MRPSRSIAVAKLPNSFRQANQTTPAFREMYSKLPKSTRELCRSKCLVFNEDPGHRSLRSHDLKDNSKGSHSKDSVSISVTMRYRAIYVVDEDGINVWYWIGTHDDYDTFTGT
jgi:hypothetical protein